MKHKYFLKFTAIFMLAVSFVAVPTVDFLDLSQNAVAAPKKKTKKKTKATKTNSNVSSGAMPYFQLANEYANDMYKAKSKWIGKEICIESEITHIENSTAFFAKESNNKVVLYVFHFGLPHHDFRGNPEAVRTLAIGQKVKIKGKVFAFQLIDGGLGIEIVEPQIIK